MLVGNTANSKDSLELRKMFDDCKMCDKIKPLFFDWSVGDIAEYLHTWLYAFDLI